MARILVADDAPAVLDVLDETLSKEGHQVIRAATGVEAIRKFEEARPDLAVLDIMMPDVDGLMVLESIRRTDARIPVILITGLPNEDVAGALARYDAVALLEKGSGLDRFVELVNKTLGIPGKPGA